MRSRWKAAPALVVMIAFATSSYAENYTLSIRPSAAQSVRYDRGISSIDSAQDRTIVRVVNVPGNDKRTVSFVIGIVNAGSQPFNFGPENISIRPAGMEPIALTTYEQAMEAERRRQGRERFLARVAAVGRALSAADAGDTYSSGTYSGTTSGYVGNNLVTVQTNGIYSGTQHDPGAASAAQRNAQEMNAQDRANLEERWAARLTGTSNLLRTTTVDPGMMYGGVATFPVTRQLKRARGTVPVSIEVTVAGVRHVFSGELSRAQ